MASEKTVKVRLDADVSSYIANLNKASGATEAAGKKITQSLGPAGAQKSINGMGAAMGRTTSFVQKHDREMRTASTSALAFGGAAALGIGLAVKTFAEFDQQMSAVKATGADAAQNIDALRKAAMDAGREFGQFTGKDAAKGIEELAKAGIDTAQILSGALTGALSLAAAGGLEVGTAAEYVAKTMSQFQLEGKDAGRIADVLAASAGKAVGEVGDFGAALGQVGLVANQYGLDMEETAGTLALFAQNSLVGSDSGTAMKAMLLQLASPTKEAQKSLDAYNISAYDANGNFVGMANLADQLKTNLGELSQEQQNAALKTIFGADAIRSASLLMREGGASVRQWTKDVSEQGYAAQVAATKMDNLQGDLEGLGGAWENMMISMGEGANSPLRNAVQGVTELVDRLANTPPAAQQFVLASAAVLGSVALIGGGLMKGVTAAAEVREAWTTLATDAPKLSRAMRTVAGAAAVAAGAIIALKVIDEVSYGKQLIDGLEAATTTMLAASRAAEVTGPGLQGVLDASSAANAELDKFFRKPDGSALTGEIDTLDEAFRRMNPNMQTWATNLDDKVNNAIAKAGGPSSPISRLTEQFGEMDKALLGMANNGAGDAAAKSFAQIAASSARYGKSTEDLLALFPSYHAALQQQANALEMSGSGFEASTLSAQDYVDWMGGKIPASVKSAGDAAKKAGKDIDGLTTSTDKNTESAALAEAVLKGQRDAYLALASAALQLSGSQMGVEAAIDDATASLKENGKTLDIGTEKGRANRSALDDIAAAAIRLSESQKDSNASTEELAASMTKNRDSFVKTAEAMGMNKAEAEALADTYGLIPDKVSTLMATPGAPQSKKEAEQLAAALKALPDHQQTTVLAPGARPAKADVDAFMKSLVGIPAEKQAAIRTIADLQGVDAARAAIASVVGKTVTVTTRHVNTYTGAVQSSAKGQNVMEANGGVLEFFRNGGLKEHHVAQIAPAGAWRVWAEDETGGEAYIPLSPTKRERSMDILEEVAYRFGRKLMPNANGSIMTTGPRPMPSGGGQGTIGSMTFAPVLQTYGADPQQVAAAALSKFRHEARAMAVHLPGGYR